MILKKILAFIEIAYVVTTHWNCLCDLSTILCSELFYPTFMIVSCITLNPLIKSNYLVFLSEVFCFQDLTQ